MTKHTVERPRGLVPTSLISLWPDLTYALMLGHLAMDTLPFVVNHGVMGNRPSAHLRLDHEPDPPAAGDAPVTPEPARPRVRMDGDGAVLRLHLLLRHQTSAASRLRLLDRYLNSNVALVVAEDVVVDPEHQHP
jgi:hypothetical protein